MEQHRTSLILIANRCRGHGVHHYHFKIYALDTELGAVAGLTKDRLLEAIEGHILDKGELIGTYERR